MGSKSNAAAAAPEPSFEDAMHRLEAIVEAMEAGDVPLAELLAKYLAGRLRDELRDQHKFIPDVVRMEVEESFGQIAKYEWRK